MAYHIQVESDRGDHFGVVTYSKAWTDGAFGDDLPENSKYGIGRNDQTRVEFETKAEADAVKRLFDLNTMCDHFSFVVVQDDENIGS